MKKLIKMLYIANKYDKNISFRNKSSYIDKYFVGYKSTESCFGYCIFVFYYYKFTEQIYMFKYGCNHISNNEIYETLIKTIQHTRKQFYKSIILE